MYKRLSDDAIYVSAYLGKGDIGERIRSLIVQAAKREGIPVSQFIAAAAVKRAQDLDAPRVTPQPAAQYPPPQPYAQSYKVEVKPVERAKTQRYYDDDDDFPPPLPTGQAPPSKPSL